jgi:hypothetical protein
MVWKIVLQIIAVLTAIVIANLDYLWHDKRTRKFKHTRLFLYLLAAITLIVSVVVTIQGDRQHEREVQQLTSALDNLQRETSTFRSEAKNSGKEQQSQMAALLEGNKRLQDSLAPFQDLAKKRYPDLEGKEALEKLRTDISAVEKRAAELEKKVQASDPVLQPIRAAKATVELQVESDDQINTTYMDRGGYFALGRGNTPILVAGGREAIAKQLGNNRVLWRAVWDMDASDQAVGKQVKFLKEAEFCQITFLMMPKNSKVINGSVRLTINNDVQLDFAIPQQRATEDRIFIRNISKILNLLQERPNKASEQVTAPDRQDRAPASR